MSVPVHSLFEKIVTRDIPPVVYFHQNTDQDLADEVREYIITGGWRPDHPNHQREADGIHEQLVGLLEAIADQVERGLRVPPAVWISGFYGSGKSSFAKLLGYALDGRTLPDSTPLADALIAQDRSQNKAALRAAWDRLIKALEAEPLSVVFDIGGSARGTEQVHATVLRQVRERLAYCPAESVAAYELKLQKGGHYARFEALCRQITGRPWAEVRLDDLVEQTFAQIMSEQFPEAFPAPVDWFLAFEQAQPEPSAADAVQAIAEMLEHRGMRDRTVFIVVDEVSQYLHQDTGRMLAVQSFVSELQQRMQGKVWLLVTGQEKLDDAVAQKLDFGKMQDRFPPRFRVHLGRTNVRTVVHRRLLQKKPSEKQRLRDAFAIHRPRLELLALGCESISEEDFVDLYPLLPGHVEIILKITSALRRSSRSKGDDQTIRGLLQLLGEVFRQGLADAPFGALVTLEHVYDVQHTSLEGDTQESIARALNTLADGDPLAVRIIKAVALLQLIVDEGDDTHAVSADRVARALYARLGDDSQVDQVAKRLEALQRMGVLGYTERRGFKLQSSAAEEWASERNKLVTTPEERSDRVRAALERHMERPDRATFKGTRFNWAAVYSDGRQQRDAAIKSVMSPNALTVDFRYLPDDEAKDATWRRKSDEGPLRNRLIWICGDREAIDQLASELGRSEAMLTRTAWQRGSMSQSRKELLLQEEGRRDDLRERLAKAVADGFLGGALYFRGVPLDIPTLGGALATVLERAGERVLPQLFQHFDPTRILPKELDGLLAKDLVGVSAKFIQLGLLKAEDAGYAPTCDGIVPTQILSFINEAGASSGTTLLSRFGGPPYGYDPSLVRATVAALLQGSKVRAQPEGRPHIGAMRDVGARDLFTRDRDFKTTVWAPSEAGEIKASDRARIIAFFKAQLDAKVPRDDGKIADAVDELFPQIERDLHHLELRFKDLPAPGRAFPDQLVALEAAVQTCLSNVRRTIETVAAVKRSLPVLNTGAPLLKRLMSELDVAALEAVKAAARVRDIEGAQLVALGGLAPEVKAAIERIEAHLQGEAPWLDARGLTPDLEIVRQAYRAAREAQLVKQAPAIEAVREGIKRRKGYDALSAAESNQVLSPLRDTADGGGVDATEPALVDLHPGFEARLRTAEAEAMERCDRVLQAKARAAQQAAAQQAALEAKKAQQAGEPAPVKPVTPVKPSLRIVPVRADLRGVEIDSVAELDAEMAKLRARIEAKLAPGVRVRIV